MKTSLGKHLPIIFLSFLFFVFTASPLEAKVKIHSITSPGGDLELQVVTETNISFCLLYKETCWCLLRPCP